MARIPARGASGDTPGSPTYKLLASGSVDFAIPIPARAAGDYYELDSMANLAIGIPFPIVVPEGRRLLANLNVLGLAVPYAPATPPSGNILIRHWELQFQARDADGTWITSYKPPGGRTYDQFRLHSIFRLHYLSDVPDAVSLRYVVQYEFIEIDN